ncbi:zinc finger protein 28-like isoform X2 [Malaya genurostris]|uniref:zinc finger protein 28-like isoform X2 n=1 Tax=Malaya genurostris TaxID=325434 RepID=UPI0026F3E90A|nr:zinc finger protein 28-like isoform X2 [Malaya genurostris]
MTGTVQKFDLDMDLDKMCRICLSQTDANGQLFNIFSNAIVDGFLVRIPDVIFFCVDIQVNDAEGMPRKICQICKGQLLSFYIFKQRCKRTEKILQQTKSSKEDCEQIIPFNVQEGMQNVVESIESPKILKVSKTVDNLDSKSTINTKLIGLKAPPQNQCRLYESKIDELDHLKQNAPYCFDIDFEKTCSSDNIDAYITNDDNELAKDVKHSEYVTPTSENEEHFCLDTADTLSIDNTAQSDNCDTEDSLLQSNEAKATKNIICTICGKAIKGHARYIRHMRLHDTSTNVVEFFTYFTCTVCYTMFIQKDQFSEHIRLYEHNQNDDPSENHGELPYNCSVCSTKHYGFDRMKQHLFSHLQSFQCPFEGCGCQYGSSARLAIHITNKHIEYESYACRYCGSDEFDSMTELQQHLRVKCTEKKHQCNHCEKKFLTSRSLAQHLKCLEKTHHCLECGKSFAQPGELTLHQRTHNGDRPFQCTICGKRYRTASLRTAHMDSHIDGKTFECLLCGKKLQSRTCYRNHVRRHSEEKKHGCDICSKKFYTKYNVKEVPHLNVILNR